MSYTKQKSRVLALFCFILQKLSVCYRVSMNVFCSLKLSSWREVPLLLSCSYKPSGLGSHRDADAL